MVFSLGHAGLVRYVLALHTKIVVGRKLIAVDSGCRIIPAVPFSKHSVVRTLSLLTLRWLGLTWLLSLLTYRLLGLSTLRCRQKERNLCFR